MEWSHLCATCLQPICEGQEGIVVVGSGDRENPVSVYVHDEHRVGAKNYPRNLAEIMTHFDENGRPR